ncbi:hypothetical protein D1872_316940 [compost metagenome]
MRIYKPLKYWISSRNTDSQFRNECERHRLVRILVTGAPIASGCVIIQRSGHCARNCDSLEDVTFFISGKDSAGNGIYAAASPSSDGGWISVTCHTGA